MTDNALKPCPMCAGLPYHDGASPLTYARISCRVCGLYIERFTDDGAFAAWNTRTAPTPASDEVERLTRPQLIAATGIEEVARALEPDAFDTPLPGHEQGKCTSCDGNRDMWRDKARAALIAATKLNCYLCRDGIPITHKDGTGRVHMPNGNAVWCTSNGLWDAIEGTQANPTQETKPMTRDEIRAKYKDDHNWPIQSFDAVDWAKAFKAKWGDTSPDEATMVAWFAGALMRGYDEHSWSIDRSCPTPTPRSDPAQGR